jgi:hypothetical protein
MHEHMLDPGPGAPGQKHGSFHFLLCNDAAADEVVELGCRGGNAFLEAPMVEKGDTQDFGNFRDSVLVLQRKELAVHLVQELDDTHALRIELDGR